MPGRSWPRSPGAIPRTRRRSSRGPRPIRYASTLIVACAWASSLAEGTGGGSDLAVGEVDGFDRLRDRMLEATAGGDCGTLDEHALARLQRDAYVVPDDVAEWVLVAEVDRLRQLISVELRTEIAEAVAG